MDSGSSEQPQSHAGGLDLDDGIVLTGENAASPHSPTPIYWQHRRYESYASIGINKPPPITLEDNTEDVPDIRSPLWAKQVSIDDHVVVTGSLPRLGDYTVWNCKIDTLDGGEMVVWKRYSDFDDLRRKLIATFPNSEAAMPTLPPKSTFHKFGPDFLEKRRVGLAYFLNCVLLNPEFSAAPVTKEFIFN